ncbi:hypothetical protein [Loktanella sp. SALINAS62]|uniref:hypothetical protein n=1 Tax=Loktanella sp. SALINAS62 TaxID=2706124 RepID=UPI001B8AAEFD|nr:hypothetical protein [Loktanella sp. SALINAS62]MBS1301048.1 hypothetical protein [Loktanella sp. SALINAS62]
MLGKISPLDQSLGAQTSQGSREYFDIGFPMFEPISPVGTIAIILERSFLYRNLELFLWASIPDNGGVRYGFLPYLSKESYKSIRIDYLHFLEILEKIDTLSKKCIRDVLSKRESKSFCAAIQGLVSDRVIDGMLKQPMQAARRIEFCLEGALEVQNSDVRSVLIPNTYKHALRRSAAKVEASKIVYYNPRKTVIECLKQHELGCSWRI